MNDADSTPRKRKKTRTECTAGHCTAGSFLNAHRWIAMNQTLSTRGNESGGSCL